MKWQVHIYYTEQGQVIDDDDDTGSFAVADGLYIAGISGSDTTIVTGQRLTDTNVEDDGFGTKERSGHSTVFTYLAGGTYLFVDVEDRNAAAVYGEQLQYTMMMRMIILMTTLEDIQ